MATRGQVSDISESIRPDKQQSQLSLLYKNTKKYEYRCGSSQFDVFVFKET